MNELPSVKDNEHEWWNSKPEKRSITHYTYLQDGAWVDVPPDKLKRGEPYDLVIYDILDENVVDNNVLDGNRLLQTPTILREMKFIRPDVNPTDELILVFGDEDNNNNFPSVVKNSPYNKFYTRNGEITDQSMRKVQGRYGGKRKNNKKKTHRKKKITGKKAKSLRKRKSVKKNKKNML